MNKNIEQLNQLKQMQKRTLTTSEILQSSFTKAFDLLKKEDYILVENTRRKELLILQPLDKYLSQSVEVSIPVKSFEGKVSTKKENQLLARNFIKENVYHLMKFESKNITFPLVDTIIEKGLLSKEYEFDSMLTNNLMNAWKFILYSDGDASFEYLLKLHSLIAKDQALEWGKLRTGKVTISGTSYVPKIPTITQVKDLINLSPISYESIASLVITMIKSQLFWDGNKRTAFLFANKLLLDNSMGILAVQDKDFLEFNTLLNEYYNNEKSSDKLIKFMVKNCFYNTLDKRLI